MDPFENNRPLLDAFRRGERAALRTVYNHFVDRVFRLVRFGFVLSDGRRVPGSTDPEQQRDIIQDVFTKAFHSNARMAFDGIRPYKPFLVRIAKNAIIDRWRRAPAAIEVELDESLFTSAEHPDDSAQVEDLHWKILATATREFCASLTEEEQRFVELRFVQDLPQREIATQMQCTRRRIRTLDASVQDRLRRHLKSQGYI